MTDDTTPKPSDESTIYALLCDFFTRKVVLPGKFADDDGMRHTSGPSRTLAMDLAKHLTRHGLSIRAESEPVHEMFEVDDVFLSTLTDLKKWGAIEKWGVTRHTLHVWAWGVEHTIPAADVETYVSGLVQGWLHGRDTADAVQLHQEEREQIARMKEPDNSSEES